MDTDGTPGTRPPRAWERLLRMLLPPGTVGRSILGDLREEHARRTVKGAEAADRWYRRTAVGVAFWGIFRRAAPFRRPRVARAAGAGVDPGRGPGGFHTAIDIGVAALRSVRRSPRLAVAVAGTLALGLGANVTIFGIVDRLLLSPPDGIRDAHEVRRILVERPGLFSDEPVVVDYLTYPDYLAFKELGTFSRVAAYSDGAFERTLGRGESAMRIHAKTASADFFPALGVEPVLGRLFTEDDAAPGAVPTVVLTEPFWRAHFDLDPGVLGRALEIGEGTYTVVGVTPAGFIGADLGPADVFLNFEARARIEIGDDVDEWRNNRRQWWVSVLGRLAPGVDAAAAEAAANAAYLAPRRPEAAETDRVLSTSLVLADAPDAPAEIDVTRWLAGVSILVLLIACANAANLLLARSVSRRQQLAVQRALGLSRPRLVVQLLTESLLLAALGGVAALLLAQWLGAALRTGLFPGIVFGSVFEGWRTPAFAALAVLGATCLAGIVPALRSARRDVAAAIGDGARGATADRSRFTHVLVGVQAGLALVLLVGAGLFVQSLAEALDVDLGFDPEVLLTAELEMQGDPPAEDRMDAYYRGLEELRRLPGVRAATFHTAGPFQGSLLPRQTVEGWDSIPQTAGGGPFANPVGPDYFETLGMTVRRGRTLTAADHQPGAEPVAVVNEEMERVFWPESGALGRCIHVREGPCNRVVGVVSNVTRSQLIEDPSMAYYLPFRVEPVGQRPWAILVRMADADADPPADLRAMLMGVSPHVRFVRVGRYDQFLEQRIRSWRLGATVFTSFALLALLVTAVGLYSTLAFQVAQRRGELGIRSALGAPSDKLVRAVVAQTVRALAVGIVLGGLASLALARGVEGLLFQVTAAEPRVYAGAAATILLFGLVAAAAPAWRAACTDPIKALGRGD